jgi:hypothetical protein
MRIRAALIAALAVVAMTGQGRAQVAWDSPLLLPPMPTAGTGIYLMDAHRAGLGVLGTWRAGPGLGFRAGIAEGQHDGVAILGGADLVFPISAAGAGFPLDLSWLVGVGAGFDDWVLLSVPLGLSLGRTFVGDGVRFTPYAAPRVALDAQFGRDAPGDDVGLSLAVDLGFEMGFQPGWAIHFGASIGDRGGLAVGVRF